MTKVVYYFFNDGIVHGIKSNIDYVPGVFSPLFQSARQEIIVGTQAAVLTMSKADEIKDNVGFFKSAYDGDAILGGYKLAGSFSVSAATTMVNTPRMGPTHALARGLVAGEIYEEVFDQVREIGSRAGIALYELRNPEQHFHVNTALPSSQIASSNSQPVNFWGAEARLGRSSSTPAAPNRSATAATTSPRTGLNPQTNWGAPTTDYSVGADYSLSPPSPPVPATGLTLGTSYGLSPGGGLGLTYGGARAADTAPAPAPAPAAGDSAPPAADVAPAPTPSASPIDQNNIDIGEAPAPAAEPSPAPASDSLPAASTDSLPDSNQNNTDSNKESSISTSDFSGWDPVVIDLDGDGVEVKPLSSSATFFDIDNDGYKERTAWVGADDGLLVIDLDGDGQVTQTKEMAFAQWTAEQDTDLQALAKVFDSNQDGIFDSRDARFNEFRIWKDANSNGVADANEMVTLQEAGIAKETCLTQNALRLTRLAVNDMRDWRIA